MGDDLSLKERNAVRTGMQWSDEKNGGFSPADPEELARPVISGGDYGYETLNVENERYDPDSLLNWTERAIRARKECPEFGRGQPRVLEVEEEGVFAHVCETAEGAVLAVHNLTPDELTVDVDTSGLEGERLVEVLKSREIRPLEPRTRVELGRYGCRWMRVESTGGQ